MATVKRNEDGLTVLDMYEAMKELIDAGSAHLIIYERRGDEPMRYVEQEGDCIFILEAY